MPRITVVDDGDVDLEIFLNEGGQFGHRHLESAVADHHPHFRARARHLRADGRRQRKSHGARAAGRDQGARTLVLVVLRFPHLVLAHIGDHDRVAHRASHATGR